VRAKRIIAVFGSSRNAPEPVLACAEELGCTIVAAEQILLTGGTRPATDSVKGRAIQGACGSPWVGVRQRGRPGAQPSEECEPGFVVSTGLGDKRNYLEATMCDAAIALPGREGTLSEVTCSLSLGRPVAFVGEWREECDLDAADRAAVLARIVERTERLFAEAEGSDVIDRSIVPPVIRGGLDCLPAYDYFDLCAAQDAVRWIQTVKPDAAAFAGHFPPIPGFGDAAREYERWLEEDADAMTALHT
jgi:predicted Rossmann-fold nucleotide-binding protein